MKLNKDKFSYLIDALFGVLALLAFAAVTYFIWIASDGWFTADCADTLFWGQATLESGKIFDPNFFYGGVYCFGGSWIMIPGLLLFGVSMTAEKFGMFLFFLLLTAAIFLFCKTLRFSNRWTFFSIFVILSTLSCSVKLREIFFQHIIYYSLGNFHMLIGISLFILFLQNKNSKKGRWYGIGAFIWSLLCCTNGLESLVLYAVPILLAYGILVLTDKKPFSKKKFFYSPLGILILLCFACVIGYLTGFILTTDTVAGYAEAFSGYSDKNAWATNLLNAPFQFILLFVSNIDGDTPFKSLEGISGALQIFFAIACIIIPFIATFFYKKYKSNEERFFILIHWVTTSLILFGFTFGRLGNANWRLSPLIITSLFVCIIFFRYLWQEKGIAKRFSVLLIVCSCIVSLVTLVNVYSLDPDYQKNTGLRGLTTQLKLRDFDYAYASFWNGMPITFFSQGEIFGATIDFSEFGEILSSNYGASSNWYKGRPDEEKGALILTEAEYQQISPRVKAVFSDEEVWEEFHICTLSHDLFPCY